MSDGKFNVSVEIVCKFDIAISCINKNRTHAHTHPLCIVRMQKLLPRMTWLWTHMPMNVLYLRIVGFDVYQLYTSLMYFIPDSILSQFYSPNLYQCELRFSSWFVGFIVFMTIQSAACSALCSPSSFSFYWQNDSYFNFLLLYVAVVFVYGIADTDIVVVVLVIRAFSLAIATAFATKLNVCVKS